MINLPAATTTYTRSGLDYDDALYNEIYMDRYLIANEVGETLDTIKGY